MAVIYSGLARDNILSVSTNGSVYTTCSGINNLMLGKDTNMTEDTSFDSQGLRTNLPTSVELTIKFEGFERFTDATQATRDAGQLIVINAAAGLGNDSLVYGKLTHAITDDEVTFVARVVLDETGGGNDDLMVFNGTFYIVERGVGEGIYSKQLGSST